MDNSSSKSVILTDKQMDKVRRVVHPKLKPLPFQIKTYYLYEANYPMDNPSQTYNPPLVRTRPITMLFTVLSRVFDREYFKGTSGCYRKLNEQRPQEAILRKKKQGTCSHHKTNTVSTPLPYSIWWSGTSKKSGLIQEEENLLLTHVPRLQASSWSLLRIQM